MGMHLDPDPKWIMRAEEAVATTLDLDPVNCDAHCARALIVWSPQRGFQTRPALRAFNAALTVNPGRYTARVVRSAVLFHSGFHEAAVRDLDEAVLANPDFALAYTSRSFVAHYDGDYERSEAFNQKALAIEPGLVHANVQAPINSIYAGNLGKAREQLRRAEQMIPGESQLLSMEGLILALEGDFKRAEQLADDAAASKRTVMHLHHSLHCAAGVYAICGKPEKAIFELQRCAVMGLPNYRAFENDPYLRSLHQQPEFLALMRDLRRDHESFQQEFGLTDSHIRA